MWNNGYARLGDGIMYYNSGNPSTKKEFLTGIKHMENGTLDGFLPEEGKFQTWKVWLVPMSGIGITFDGEVYPVSLYEISIYQKMAHVMGFIFDR